MFLLTKLDIVKFWRIFLSSRFSKGYFLNETSHFIEFLFYRESNCTLQNPHLPFHQIPIYRERIVWAKNTDDDARQCFG